MTRYQVSEEDRAVYDKRIAEARVYIQLMEGARDGKCRPINPDAWKRPWIHGPWCPCQADVG